jgi:hypothetical protein
MNLEMAGTPQRKQDYLVLQDKLYVDIVLYGVTLKMVCFIVSSLLVKGPVTNHSREFHCTYQKTHSVKPTVKLRNELQVFV